MKKLVSILAISALLLANTLSFSQAEEMMNDQMMDDEMMTTSSEEGVMVGGALMVPSKDIVDNAVESSDHTTLVAAVQAAGLVETLKSEGPFTVFAPTNDAFAKLPEGTVETLLEVENKGQLTDVLTYHVVAGAYTSADITDGLTLDTVEGSEIKFNLIGNDWYINGTSKVTISDVISSNGVTHVVDSVLLPGMMEGVTVGGALMIPSKDIVDNAVNSEDHKILVDLVSTAGLVPTLKSEGPFTVFAPSDDAFMKLPRAELIVKALKKDKYRNLLTNILTYHVIPGAITSNDLVDGMTVKTVQGKSVTFTEVNGEWFINGAKISVTDAISSNGVTHVVDSIVLPMKK